MLLGSIGTVAFGFELGISLLFAAIVLPTDPVAVLPLFEELGAPERLTVLVDGESMLNDGVAVVLYTGFIEIVLQAQATGESTGFGLRPTAVAAELATEAAMAIVGGVLVGASTGYVVYRAIRAFDDELTTDGKLDTTKLDALGRLAGSEYTLTRDRLSMARPE